MNELTKILLTTSATIIVGVIVFVAGQLLGNFIIDPIHDLKKLLGEIRFGLIFYAQAILTPVGDVDAEKEASKILRTMSCDLRSKVAGIPFYNFLSGISRGFLPNKKNIYAASIQLMGLSNSVSQPNRPEKNAARIEFIEKVLAFDPFDAEPPAP
jgi:hypothetical protein